jgi:hypothetical protein
MKQNWPPTPDHNGQDAREYSISIPYSQHSTSLFQSATNKTQAGPYGP